MPPRRAAFLLIVLLAILSAAGCRLPAREWRWQVSGPEATWLDSLGEARGCGMALRLWAAPRAMWPLPLPASRPLFYGGEDLELLAIIDTPGGGRVSFDPGRVRPRLPGSDRATVRRGESAGCRTGAVGRLSCDFAIALPRGLDRFALDLRESVPCPEPAFVFQLSRERAWRWRRVGPGVPGL